MSLTINGSPGVLLSIVLSQLLDSDRPDHSTIACKIFHLPAESNPIKEPTARSKLPLLRFLHWGSDRLHPVVGENGRVLASSSSSSSRRGRCGNIQLQPSWRNSGRRLESRELHRFVRARRWSRNMHLLHPNSDGWAALSRGCWVQVWSSDGALHPGQEGTGWILHPAEEGTGTGWRVHPAAEERAGRSVEHQWTWPRRHGHLKMLALATRFCFFVFCCKYLHTVKIKDAVWEDVCKNENSQSCLSAAKAWLFILQPVGVTGSRQWAWPVATRGHGFET